MKRAQRGLTLVISLIMLVVLTLLVVSAIRFGNINLKIGGNAQAQAEAAAAAQVAIESIVKQAAAVPATINLSDQPTINTSVSTGGTTYTVTITKPACTVTKNVDPTTLTNTPANRVCFGNPDQGNGQEDASGNLLGGTAACKDQSWEIQGTVQDTNSGASVTVLQGVALRVGAQTSCP